MAVARRGFLKLLSSAPIAGPVAAKEAAASMGLSGPIGATLGYANRLGANAASCVPEPPVSQAEWIKGRIAELYTPENVARMRREAKGMARTLDSDIAAMRSISPAAAYAMQVDRCYQAVLAQERGWLDQQAEKLRSIGSFFS